jgi:hypothetical protein
VTDPEIEQPEHPEPTGHPQVDQLLERLRELDEVPTADHVAVYDEIHRGLQDVLANLDEA